MKTEKTVENDFKSVLKHLLLNDLRNSLYIARTQNMLLKYAKELNIKEEHIKELDIMLTELEDLMNQNKQLIEEMNANDKDKTRANT